MSAKQHQYKVVIASFLGWAVRVVSWAITLTFSALECASGIAPTLTVFLVLRALFDIAMGGEWGIGASLTMESIPVHWRDFVSGLLQSGWSFGSMPAHLNEISPRGARATFPGFTYQFGNFVAAGNATIQVALAENFHSDYGIGMSLVAGAGAVAAAHTH
jgi:MFS family permease